jgi:secreted PhoX family phosphatase
MNSSESPEPLNSFDSLVAEAISRRDFVRMGLGSLAVGFFAAESSAQDAQASPFTFEGVPVSSCDEVKVPKNYQPKVLYAWGDPVNGQGPAFKSDGTNTTAEQKQQAGMGHDGMQWFRWPEDEKDGSKRGLLVMNHEYTDPGLMFEDGLKTMSKDKIEKSQAAHGVSVIAVAKQKNGEWKVVPSKWSRRITANTPMTFTGPAAGCDLLKTNAYQDGMTVLGTFNNCASGKTPWGTYLTCEENVHGYFGSKDLNFKPNPDQKRYGFKRDGESFKESEAADAKDISRYQWWKHEDSRFDLKDHPNEPHRFGYVVEIDPQNPEPKPRKHTALGRFRHENAAVTLSKDNRAVVYMGDDAKNEYIYKFVSKGVYDSNLANREANMTLLESGTLYVAKFENGGKGTWIPLVQGQGELTKDHGFEHQYQISVRTRQAADRAGATSMDRPEWIAVQPGTGKVFVTLTNNSNRGKQPGSPNSPDGTTEDEKAQPPINDANPRTGNPFGHIISWDEAGGDAAAVTFDWSIFILAGDPKAEEPVGDEPRVNIKEGQDHFGSPDGLTFDDRGILWIQTDVSSSKLGKKPYQNLGNNMMLAADPATGMVRRFLTGPRGCEITGLAFTPDLQTMFVNIQHPGEPSKDGHPSNPDDPKAVSTWPDGLSGGRPRPATVVITHLEGKAIGA